MGEIRDQTLGTFTTPDLLTELVSRMNIECLVAVRFLDGSGNSDPDTVYLCGRWHDGSADSFKEAIDEYLTEDASEDTEED